MSPAPDERAPQEGPENEKESPARELDRITAEILQLYQSGDVDPEPWFARYPEHKAALDELFADLEFMPRLSEVEPGPWIDYGGVAKRAFAEARAYMDRTGPEQQRKRLGRELEAFRKQNPSPPEFRNEDDVLFRRQVVYLLTVRELQRRGADATRWPAHKAFYILDRGLRTGIGRHQRHRRGMFDPFVTRDVETEGQKAKNGWVKVESYTYKLEPGAERLWQYADRYVRSPQLAQRLFDLLARLSEFELETWTTVENAATELIPPGEPITVEGVRQAIKSVPVWAEKLSQPNFRDEKIREALQHLADLRFLPPERLKL